METNNNDETKNDLLLQESSAHKPLIKKVETPAVILEAAPEDYIEKEISNALSNIGSAKEIIDSQLRRGDSNFESALDSLDPKG